MAFEDQHTPAKQIHPSDILRFFRVNNLAIDEEKVRFHLFGRIVNGVFDYKLLHKLLTGEKKQAIVYNPAVTVSGMCQENRRTVAHRQTLNPKALASLTAPKEAFAQTVTTAASRAASGQQPLRNRRSDSGSTLCDTSCRLGKAAHTKCFQNDNVKV